jgi:hypothetical protein
MCSSRIKKTLEILQLLGQNNQVSQNDLEKLRKTTHHDFLWQLRVLENGGLISAKTTAPASKRERKKQVWSLTFLGLLQLFSLDDITEDDFDKMAKNHKDKWLLFKEWAYLSQDQEIKMLIILNTRSYADLKQPWNNASTAKEFATHTKKSRNAQNEFHKFMAQLKETEATRAALMLEDIFSLGGPPSWIYESTDENDILIRLWKHAIKNRNLRKFIMEQFENEEIKHNAIKAFEAWLLQK